MSRIFKCDHCKQEIITKLPSEKTLSLKPFATIRPYRIEVDRMPNPSSEEYCGFFSYTNEKFDLCIECKQLLLEFMGIK